MHGVDTSLGTGPGGNFEDRQVSADQWSNDLREESVPVHAEEARDVTEGGGRRAEGRRAEGGGRRSEISDRRAAGGIERLEVRSWTREVTRRESGIDGVVVISKSARAGSPRYEFL